MQRLSERPASTCERVILFDRQSDIETIWDIIRYLRSTGRSITYEYENWVRVAYAIAATFSPKFGDTFFLLLSQQDADKFDPDACRRLLGYCYAHSNGQTTFGTIVFLAREAGYATEVEGSRRRSGGHGCDECLVFSV